MIGEKHETTLPVATLSVLPTGPRAQPARPGNDRIHVRLAPKPATANAGSISGQSLSCIRPSEADYRYVGTLLREMLDAEQRLAAQFNALGPRERHQLVKRHRI